MPGLEDRRRIHAALLAPPFLYRNASTGTIGDGDRRASDASARTAHRAVIPAGALLGGPPAFPACGTGAKLPAANTEVQVTKRVLWVGGDAYPLHNIARAQVRRLHPRPGTPVRDFLVEIVRWIALAILLITVMALTGLRGATIYVFVILALLILVSVLKLMRAISREREKKDYYLLVLQTSGDPRTLLASTDREQIYDLVQTIMAAIDDAAVTYHNWISNYYGDVIRQYGNENIGKIIK
jgi:hypothetical protein